MKNGTKRRLQQDKVTRYVHISAEIDKLEKQRLKLRTKMVKLMEQGYVCPKSGPYLVVLSYQERRPVAWKEQWIRQAKKVFGPNWKKVMKQLVAKAPLIQTPLLLTRPNPDYRHVTMDKIVEFKRKHVA